MRKRDGIEVYGRTVTYDANGKRESGYGMRTANAENSSVSKSQDRSDSIEERIRKRREEKEEMEARLAEKRRKKRNLRNDWKRCVRKEKCIWSILLRVIVV